MSDMDKLLSLLDDFEHECFMVRVEASETRAMDDVVRKAYEQQREKTAQPHPLINVGIGGQDRIGLLVIVLHLISVSFQWR